MKRYSTCMEWAGLKEDPNGEWVKYSELAALGKDARLLVQIIDGEICECGCDMDGNVGIEEVCLICQLSAIARRILEATKKGE